MFRFQRNKVSLKGLINSTGFALTDIKPSGEVLANKKKWKAKAFNHQQINKEDNIEVVDIKNLLLIVRKIKQQDKA